MENKVIINSRFRTSKDEYGGEINIRCFDTSTFFVILNFLESITESPIQNPF